MIGILVEHFDGRLPLWLAPEAVRVLPVGADQSGYARELAARLAGAGARSSVAGDGPLGGRIREAHRLRIPLVAIVGAREMAAAEVVLRPHGGRRQVVKSSQDVVAMLGDQVARRRSQGQVDERL